DLDSGPGAAAGADAGGVDGDPTVVLGPEDRDRSGHLGETEVLDETATEPFERAGLIGGEHRCTGVDDTFQGMVLRSATRRKACDDAVENRRDGEGIRDPIGVD